MSDAGRRPRPVGGWVLSYEGFDPDAEGLREALCTLGNGYLATRGAAPESRADGVHYPGTYLAGGYNRLTTELAGRIVENEDLVNMPNWLPLSFRADDSDWFSAADVDLQMYRQDLDLRRGVLTRLLRFRDGGGRVTSVTQRRLVDMSYPHLAGLETTFVAENWSGRLHVRSMLDGQVRNTNVARYRQLRDEHLTVLETGSHSDEVVYLVAETNGSRLRVAQAARTRAISDNRTVALPRTLVDEGGRIGHELSIDMHEGEQATVEKVVTFYTARDAAMYEPGLDARALAERADSFDAILQRHLLAWDHLWRRFDIVVDGDDWAQVILRLHIFHLLQTVSENTINLDAGVPARGLHGEAYRGHIFWDELFIFPFLNFHDPVLTRSLLDYRGRRLPEARWAAREAGYEGAMYPWQSGSTGREESQTLHLNPRSGRWGPDNSQLQRHINIAVAYNVWQHYQVTGSVAFLRYHGAEPILEIARFWSSLARYNRARDRYEICGVMGPDEYHDGYPDRDEPGLDNNAYTNVMVVWLLCRALDVCTKLPDYYCEEIWEHLNLSREEIDRWEDISRKMYVPFHDGVISQFEGYEDLLDLDWDAYRRKYGDIHRMDRILEAEDDTANRYKVSKQADVLMLFYLLSPHELEEVFARIGYSFDPDRDIWRNVDYYMARTSHGSTLSSVVHSWVLARFDPQQSWELFLHALHSDVEDVQGGTTPEGIHLGAMAGTVDIVERAYMGIEVRDDVLWLDPTPPQELPRLSFDLLYRDHRLRLEVADNAFRVTSRSAEVASIKVGLDGEVLELHPGDVVERSLKRDWGPQAG